jgi:vacuolar protein sorting-associated protein 35
MSPEGFAGKRLCRGHCCNGGTLCRGKTNGFKDHGVLTDRSTQVLNRYLYYFEQENETITTRFVNGLIELIYSNLQTADSSQSLENAKKHFQRTLDYVKSRDYEGVVIDAPQS